MHLYLSASPAPEDLALLDELLKQLAALERQGTVLRSVRNITAGGDVRSERLRMLAAAHIVLLLVSADALNADPWQEEAREALLYRKLRGTLVIPVLLRPTAGWEDEPFGALSPLPQDGKPLSLAPHRDQAFCEVADEVRRQARAHRARSGPTATYLPPPAAAYDPRHYVPRPREERSALRRLQHPGAAVVLQGPRGFGKATLVSHLLAQLSGLRVRVDLGALDPALLRDPARRLRWIAEQLLLALLPERADLLDLAFQRQGTPEACLHWLLDQHLLTAPLLLCLENAARLHGLPGEYDFFGLLRGLVESQPQLRLLVTVDTEPMLLDSTDHSGFFARSSIMELQPLSLEQVGQMAVQYGFAPTAPGLDRLCLRTAGHPYLARLWLYEAAMREEQLDQLSEAEVFAPHLRGLRRQVDEALLGPELARAQAGSAPPDAAYVQLYSLGLLSEQDGRCQLRCPLYEEFAKARWPKP